MEPLNNPFQPMIPRGMAASAAMSQEERFARRPSVDNDASHGGLSGKSGFFELPRM